MRNAFFTIIATSIPLARAHIAFWDPSMWGYPVNDTTYGPTDVYDNRPVAPLMNRTFAKWWFHDHLAFPPAPGNFFELPAGGKAMSQLACNRGATKWWRGSESNIDLRSGDYDFPCPGGNVTQFHGLDDVKGCALSITYNPDEATVKPEDFAIFSVNHTCVWTVNTTFPIPHDMPPCPEGGCICGWHWIHSQDSGSAQMFLNNFRCNVTGSTSKNPIMKPQVPKRCTNDPSACYKGAQQPMYWWQDEGNNMPNTQYDPPFYLNEWGFFDGAQNGIFETSNGNTSTLLSNDTLTSTPANQPSSTPPAEDNPSSTPVDNESTPTLYPSSPPGKVNAGDPSPFPTNSFSYSYPNSQSDGESHSWTKTASHHRPTSSKQPRCNDNKNKKRQEVVSRHFKHKRHYAHEHNH